jgi:hypothetical protein
VSHDSNRSASAAGTKEQEDLGTADRPHRVGGVVAELESEHGQTADALSGAENAIATFSTNPSAINVAAAHATVVELARVLGDQLAHEGRDLEPFGAEHHDTRQHKGRCGQGTTPSTSTRTSWPNIPSSS